MTGPDDPRLESDSAEPDTATSDPSSPENGGDGAGPAPANARSGAWAGNGRGRAHQEAYDAGAVRALRGDIDDLRRELRRGLSGSRDQLRDEFRSSLGEATAYISELLPRVHDLEDRVAALLAGHAHASATGAAGPDGAGPETTPGGAGDPGVGDEDDGPPATQATGWDGMDRDRVEEAWTALTEFVDTVLYRQYRLSRLQIPDCWPVHPRMVRELAWLRSSYLEARDAEAEAPAVSMPWHIRAIPGFLINTADAVDVRECRPGIHRLTDPEVSRYATQRMTARHEGRPEPVLTAETGPERPQLHPEHYPTRSTSTAAAPQDGVEARPPTVVTLPDLIVGACHPDYWIGYYREASASDLANRD